MSEKLKKEEKFFIIRRAESFTHAWRGIWIFLRGTHNVWIHLTLLAIAIAMGFYFEITQVEWLVIILVAGLVIVAEAFNTAIEIDMDLTSPNYHPYARDTKDVAAGAVLISAIVALTAGAVIFLPYIIRALAY